jgi:hypothetical protein
MSYLALLKQTATLNLVYGAELSEDDHGNPVYATAFVDLPCHLAKQASTDEGEDGNLQAVTFKLFLKEDAPLTGWDSVTVDECEYQVIGHPYRVHNPRTGNYHHVEADIRRVA